MLLCWLTHLIYIAYLAFRAKRKLHSCESCFQIQMTNSNYLIRHVLTEVNWSQLSKWTKSQKHLVKSILNCLTNLLWVRNIPLAY